MAKLLSDGRTVPKRVQDIDRYIGLRIRERRIMLGLTQQQLAELIGVTYQQEHKYEKGINRITAGRLADIARVLSVDIGYFFDGMKRSIRSNRRRSSGCSSNSAAISRPCPGSTKRLSPISPDPWPATTWAMIPIATRQWRTKLPLHNRPWRSV